MYTESTPVEQEPTKFSVKEVLDAYASVNGLNSTHHSEIDKVTHYLLDTEDEYSTYIRLKEKFEGATEHQSPPESEYDERELTGYHYSDGTGICFGDEIEYELPRKFLRAPYSLPPTRLCGKVVKVFADCGVGYDLHVNAAEVRGRCWADAPTLKSIVETASHIKKVN
jgi:hypothetical protein